MPDPLVVESFEKDPGAEKPYTLDWSEYLAGLTGDTILTSTWAIPGGLTAPNPSTFDDTTSTVWLGSGTAGTRYTVTNTITTVQGITDDRSILITIVDL